MSNVIAELTKLLTEGLAVDATTVTPDTPLFEGGLELDSFATVEIVTKMETHFGIQLNDDDFAPENFKDIQTLAGVVEKYRA